MTTSSLRLQTGASATLDYAATSTERQGRRRDGKPLTRGLLHLLAAPVVLAGTGELALASRHPVAALLFGFAATALLATSGLYHTYGGRLSLAGAVRFARADAAAIVLLVTATIGAMTVAGVHGAWRTAILAAVSVAAAVGVAVSVAPVSAPRQLRAVGYLLLGWAGVVPVWRLLADGGAVGVVLLLATGGILYSLGEGVVS